MRPIKTTDPNQFRCCFCFHVRTGTVILGVFHLLEVTMPPKKKPVVSNTSGKPAVDPARNVTKKNPATTKTLKKNVPASKNRQLSKPVGSSQSTGKKSQPSTKSDKSEVKKWTKQDEAAVKIQSIIRQFLSKRTLHKLKKTRQDYLDEMDRLEKEAFVYIVRMQQEEAEKEMQKEEEERKRKREEAKRRKRMLEASFDGDNDDILAVLNEVAALDDKMSVGHDIIGKTTRDRNQMKMVDCEDAHNNTPLSEASSGGHCKTIKLLIDRGANPNSRGRFRRTPLYRAAFAGHFEACQMLLQYGADPRLTAEDGETPEEIASHSSIKEFIRDWDISQTENLLSRIEADLERRREQERKTREAVEEKLEEKIKVAEADYEIRQKQLIKFTEELNRRITEHDTAVASGFDKPEITLQCIHEAEADLEIAKIEMDKSRDNLSKARLQLRDQQAKGVEGGAQEDDLPGLKIVTKELDDVLMRDVGNKISDSGKWPLLIDTSGQAALFLKYRDTNYIRALSPLDMQPDKIRLAVLGAVRYGKPVVLDMMEVDMFDTCIMRFDEVLKGLMDHMMDKTITREEVYAKLIRKTDGVEYDKNQFIDLRTEHFKFIIVTKNKFPSAKLLNLTYPIRVCVPT